MSDFLDPIRLEIFKHLYAAAAEEMGAVLRRSAFSPNIKERRDFSCAVFDSGGRMVAQAAHIPVHLGSMPLSVAAALERFPSLQPGDAVILNDPYRGGTHLPDITLVSPVFAPGSSQPFAFVASPRPPRRRRRHAPRLDARRPRDLPGGAGHPAAEAAASRRAAAGDRRPGPGQRAHPAGAPGRPLGPDRRQPPRDCPPARNPRALLAGRGAHLLWPACSPTPSA